MANSASRSANQSNSTISHTSSSNQETLQLTPQLAQNTNYHATAYHQSSVNTANPTNLQTGQHRPSSFETQTDTQQHNRNNKSNISANVTASTSKAVHYNANTNINPPQLHQNHNHHLQQHSTYNVYQNSANNYVDEEEDGDKTSCDDENMYDEPCGPSVHLISDANNVSNDSFEENAYIKNEPVEESSESPLPPQNSDLSLSQLMNQYSDPNQMNGLSSNQVLLASSASTTSAGKSKASSSQNTQRPFKCDLCTKTFVRLSLIYSNPTITWV